MNRSFLERAMDHLPSLVRVARRLTRSHAEADDLVQDTLIRALDKQGDVQHPERLRAWLLATQRTVFLNSTRRLGHRLEVLEGGAGHESPNEPSGNLEEEILSTHMSQELDAALGALPSDWRDALWLREVEGLSYEEIATIQACPLGTVRSRLARARQAMVLSLHDAGGHGSPMVQLNTKESA